MRITVMALTLLLTVIIAPQALATNGDMLISVAPTARSMGGAGVAAPQDAISAIFANPAAMCMSPYCPGSQSVFAGTFYQSSARATINGVSADSQMEPFIIPAVGIATPITNKLRFGFGAYGLSGMGVDYREQGLLGGMGDVYTNLQVMKFAPNMAYLVTPNLSMGASLHMVYGAMDLGSGSVHDYTIGGQFGTIYKAGPVAIGINYTTPEKINYKKVAYLDDDPFDATPDTLDNLALESPHTVAAGIAFMPNNSFLVEIDAKWLNWSQAEGYNDFDWEDQLVYAVGMQYKHPKGLSLRAGYNYGKSPVKAHNNFDATPTGTPFTKIQGKNVPTTAYELMRTVGFPAVQEHHVTAGIGYKFSKTFEMHLGYMHAFKNSIETSGTGFDGTNPVPASFKSEIAADTFEFGLVWNYPRIMGW